ncbi:bifunctional diguanylate cyclase/phosphodiesterase [Persephonella sp.]|uniref:putative bifunctional diguanylate cyclase/phosphodiesterase n=1 Tax=Persephonella sp. TaxID=2060922 RepID=UPI00261A753C|nr:bifunctional diguanylate cyclase/phosphodiesterase [Persephonella sp.]
MKQKQENRYLKYNQFLEKRAGIKSYGQKVVLVLILLFFISFIAAAAILTVINIQDEIQRIKISLEKTINIEKKLIKKELETIENNAKVFISTYEKKKNSTNTNIDFNILKKSHIYSIYNNVEHYTIGRKIPISSVELLQYSDDKYILLTDYLIINMQNMYYVFVNKSAFDYILSPQNSPLSDYDPVFVLKNSPKTFSSFICSSSKFENSNFYIIGCVDKSTVIYGKIISTVFGSIVVFSVFFLLSLSFYTFFFKKILLYPINHLRKNVQYMSDKGLEKVTFDLHKYGDDEFAKISQVLEATRQKILKHQKGMNLVLTTTAKMISMTNDIHNFALFAINSLDELLNAEGSVLCLYSKLEDHCSILVHSDNYLLNKIPFNLEEKEFKKLQKTHHANNIILDKNGDRYIASIKKEVNDEYSLYIVIFKRGERLSEEELKYTDMILSHLVYSINLLNLATYDPLTRLYNRRAIVEYAEKEVERAKRYNHDFSIILLDIDDFKGINDTYGHTMGDIVLKQVAEIIQEETRDVDKVGRYGGEEFIIVLPETETESALRLAERIRKKISEKEFKIGDYKISITISAGVAGLGIHGETFEEILQAADLALYQAKKNGKNQVVMLGKEEISQILEEEFESKNFLLDAISEDRVIPYFQPIVDLNTFEIVGYEVLARIKEGDRVIPAYKFITTAIKFGIVLKIDEIIQRKTVEFLLKSEKVPQMIFFNLSRPYIQDIYHISQFVELLEKNNIPKENIVLEITEEEAISEITIVKEAIRIAKSKGIRFALDDFGVGYSTFSYIKHFDIDIIKLDGSLVKNIHKDNDNQIIVGGIAYICREKGIKLLAEMVETEEEVKILRELGVSYAQGYIFGKPQDNFIENIMEEL